METLNKLLQINGNYITIGLIVVFFVSENLFETQYRFNNTRKHLLENIGFEVIKFLPSLFWSVIIVKSIVWLNNHEIGLFYLISIPYWLKLILSVLIYDLCNYWLHRTAHIIPFIWRFHRVHYSDSRMDASSGMRTHPIEVVFYLNSSTIIASVVFGFDLFSVGLFYFILVPWFFFRACQLKIS